VIAHLIDQHGVLVGTSMSRPFGAWLIDSATELEEVCGLLRSRTTSTLKREAALKGGGLRALLQEIQWELIDNREAP